MLDGESELSEHPDGAGLPALEITGGKALARGELISCAQDRFRWVRACVPDQLISCGAGETMLREKNLFGPSRSYSCIARNTSARVTWSHASDCVIGPPNIVVAWISGPP